MAYLPLSTANLPDPVINPAQGASPEDYFNTVLWTGDGTSGRSITTGHQPDFVWTKERNSAINHIAQNSISGTGLYLHPNTTAAEQSATTLITSFDSNGFTIGNSGSINGSSDTYVAWSWKANGSGVSNTDGSITSTVSANTTSGFSIVKFIGDNDGVNTSKTIGHGLSNPPEVVIIKQTELNAWYVYHKSLGATQVINLDQTVAASTNASVWNNTAPDSNVFTVGWNGGANGDTKTHISYCFHSVEGFSKFGSYVGNGSTDGPFVYTGFRPAFVMIKRTSTSGANWYMTDDARYDTNRGYGSAAYLYADTSAAEMTTENIDMLSNGFKLRRDSGLFNYPSGDTFIYMAFAENPFKYSNAR